MFNYEFEAAWSSGASSKVVDTVEGVLVRGYVIASPRGRKCGPGKQVLFGDAVERRRSRSFWRLAQADFRMSRWSQDQRRSRARSRERRVRRALTGWCRLGVPASDKGRQRSADQFVVKALPAVTTRGGSAWQTSKGVLPTGALAAKHRKGSVDGIDCKVDSRGSKARITDRRTEADEVNYLANPPPSS